MSRRLDLIHGLGYGGACLFVACLYLSPAHSMPALAFLRPAMLGAASMLIALALRRVMRGEPMRLAGGVGGAMTVLFALLLLSPLWALDPTIASGFSFGAIKLILVYAGLVSVLRRPALVQGAMTAGVFASVVPAIGTLQRYNAGIGLVEGFRGAWIGLLANPNELAMVMAVTVPWTLHLAQTRRGPVRLVALAALGLECATVVVTHSRGGALGLALALLGSALLSTQKARAIGLGLLAAGAMVVFAPQSFWNRTQTIGHYQLDASAQGRLKSWDTGFTALKEHPLLGIGAGNYQVAWNRYQPRNTRERSYASHNTWMQVVVELGTAGFAAFLTMLLLLARGLWRLRQDPENGALARTLLISLATLALCGTTGGYAFNWFFYMVLGLAGAVLANARQAAALERVDAVGVAVA